MKEQILKLRKKGYSIKKISQELKCAKSTVSYHINKVNLGGNINNIILDISPDLVETIINMRKDLKTYDEILSVVDISRDLLKNICRKNNLSKVKKNVKQEDIDEYYKICKSIELCAKHFNVGTYYIRHHITNELVNNKLGNALSKSQKVVTWRKRRKIELVEYKGGKCEICGYDKSIRALQFHHKSPKGKDFTISGKSYSKEKLIKEVDKCILVCSNCHIEIHEKLDNDGYNEH